MANCYRCGAPGANYRRNTFTGSSTSSWSSRRSFGSGSRTYYGVRSVCHGCAKSIDTWNRIKLVFWIIVIGLVILAYSNRSKNFSKNNMPSNISTNYKGETAKVISPNGLNLRDSPNSNGNIIQAIPYNETVRIIEKNGNLETISGQSSNWFNVEYNGTAGWIWSGYLQEN
jgi:uncharacterized protein YgiM (DUF1202 family)